MRTFEHSGAMFAVPEVALHASFELWLDFVVNEVRDLLRHFHATDFYNSGFHRFLPPAPLTAASHFYTPLIHSSSRHRIPEGALGASDILPAATVFSPDPPRYPGLEKFLRRLDVEYR